jgi:hypothetical protein
MPPLRQALHVRHGAGPHGVEEPAVSRLSRCRIHLRIFAAIGTGAVVLHVDEQ